MLTRLHTAFVTIAFLISSSLLAQDFSNKGKDFWIGYGNHVRMFGGTPYEQMQLYITSDVSTTGTVTIASVGFTQNFTVTANQITTINIPRSAALMDDGLYNHGIHVTANQPVVVYSFIYVNAVSGATVCLPTNTLGRDYYSVNYTQRSNEQFSHSYFFVIAADTGTTTVEITPSQATQGGKTANIPFLVTLTQGQIYQVLGAVSGSTGVDLTGSRIRSMNNGSGCKRIAVFCGSGKVSIGCGSPGTSDNLYQQMYPTATWGKKYITVPSLANSNNFYRIMKSDPSANVKLNGTAISVGSFVNGFYYEFTNASPNVIEADQPILVAQYFSTQNCAGNSGNGDPEMIYLNPVEQTIAHVTLNSMQPATGTNINTHYMNVVLKNDAAAISSFKIDGSSYNNFKPVPVDNNYVYAQVTTSAGTHNVTCDTGFNIIAYGFGNAESYGFSGGTNLKDLYQFISIKNKYSIVDYPATCTNAPFNFSITFPYMPTKIQWVFGGIYKDTTINTPVPDSTFIKNGKQLYLYQLPDTYHGPAAGTYPIKILANNPTLDGCTGEQEIDFDLKVYPEPIAAFDVSTGGCLGDSVHFTDQSVTGDNLEIKYTWDFGDGNGSAIKNPGYLYKNIGSYNVTFSAITMVGCLTDTITKVVTISPLPVASFQVTGPYCAGRYVVVKDASTVATGSIAQWIWDMGDGQTLTRNSSDTFHYTYATPGTYTVRLVTETDKGCHSDTVTRSIIVSPVPKVGFILPENCLADPYSQFTDTSSIADGSEPAFQYLWSFGDANATPANNMATIKDPKHKYTSTGSYPVSMKITSNNGCADSVTQVLTINGTVPQSVFTSNNGIMCGNKAVLFTNHSTVDFGNIVKLEIYWDYSNDPAIQTIDDSPALGKQYTHLYPEFFTPASKTFTIKVVAYSGENCLSTSTQTITMNAIPQLQFTALPSVCADVAPFQITQVSVLNGLAGLGIFSGSGVNGTGWFNPASAATGVDSITYTFAASNGCTNFIKQGIEVYPLPVVNAGPDSYLLEGESLTLPATASGKNLSYVWTPATALSSATILQPAASPVDDITYKLMVTTGDGCKAADYIAITVLKLPRIPNAFSPNGDGIHDRWDIRYLNTYPGATVEVYNRYGQLVFRSNGYSTPWDGTFNGNALPVGTYYYIINPRNGRKQMSGYVDIIR